MVHPRHQALMDVSNYPDDIGIPSFQRRIKCGKCAVDAGVGWTSASNWKEAPGSLDGPGRADG
jgi:hypothetical protein